MLVQDHKLNSNLVVLCVSVVYQEGHQFLRTLYWIKKVVVITVVV